MRNKEKETKQRLRLHSEGEYLGISQCQQNEKLSLEPDKEESTNKDPGVSSEALEKTICIKMNSKPEVLRESNSSSNYSIIA